MLAFALLLAQTLLAAHGVEHLEHEDSDLCEICLAGAPLGAALGTPLPGILALTASPLLPQPAAVARPPLRAIYSAHPARPPPHADRS